jgi:hypothetical protein
MKAKLFLFSFILLGCGSKTEIKSSEQDSLALDSATANLVGVSPTPTTNIKTVTQNFSEYITYPLTEDDREQKVWDVLSPLIEQYDTTNFHTLSKSYTLPGTEETEDGSVGTSETVTITLFYNDAQELMAFMRASNYQIGSGDRFERKLRLCLFNKDLIGIYEDRETSLDMAVKNYLRSARKACPDCGVYMSGGISSPDVTVSSILNDPEEFTRIEKTVKDEISGILEYAYGDSFGLSGKEYVYQTVEPLNEDADYDVFFAASKGYYEKFMKPKLNR